MKKVIIIALVLISNISNAQFITNTEDDLIKFLIKVSESPGTSILSKDFINKVSANIEIQNIITPRLSSRLKLGVWYGSLGESRTGFDLSIGILYTPIESFYLFTDLYPKIHMIHQTSNEGTIGDEFSIYGIISMGCGYTYFLTKIISLYIEPGIDFKVDTPILSSQNSKLENDIMLFCKFGIIIRGN